MTNCGMVTICFGVFFFKQKTAYDMRSSDWSSDVCSSDLYESKYADVFKGDANWQAVQVPPGQTYAWDDDSTYVQNPPYFVGMGKTGAGIKNIKGARVLGLFGDKITTHHISPAGSLQAASPARPYLLENGVWAPHFNPNGTR